MGASAVGRRRLTASVLGLFEPPLGCRDACLSVDAVDSSVIGPSGPAVAGHERLAGVPSYGAVDLTFTRPAPSGSDLALLRAEGLCGFEPILTEEGLLADDRLSAHVEI
jgi:hypothetical protein